MASSLPLRYTAPELLLRPDAAAVVQLRLCAYGRNLVLYLSITRTSKFRNPWLDTCWICLDAVAAAPLLSGGLDDTARALRRDARLAALWSALTDRLCRRVLADLCAKNDVPLEPTFMSLPGDVKAMILARLPDGEDLASVECTCTVLRRLVTNLDATLWRPRYEELPLLLRLIRYDDDEPSTWKGRFMAVTRRRPARFDSVSETPAFLGDSSVDSWPPALWDDLPFRKDSFVPFRSPVPPEETVPRRRRWRAMQRDACHCHGDALVLGGGHKKQLHGAGAVNSPSSRFRWKHR